MGEAKQKAAAAVKPVTRPTLEIIQMRQAVSVLPADADPDSREFIRALGVVLAWMDVLEKTREAPAGTVKVPESEDEAVTMNLLSESWLREHAPHRLKTSGELSPTKLDA